MVQRFEVGKDYIDDMGTVARCLAATDQMAILEINKLSSPPYWSVGQQLSYYQNDTWSTWKEYHEPVVVKSQKIVCFGPERQIEGDRVYAIRPGCVGGYDNVVGKVEFTVTDGKLTGVEIL